MNRLILCVTAAISIVLFTFSANASNVLMVTWQGKLVSEETFEKELKKLRPDAKFTYVDAQRKKGVLAKELRKLDMSKYDIVYSFGTTGTKIVKEFLRGSKPHVFNIVSAPVFSGIADSIAKPGNNLTGARFLIDLKTQFDVLAKLRDYKSLAVWFDPREKQNAVVLKFIKKLNSARGVNVKGFRIIPDSKKLPELIAAASAETNKMDAMYFIPSSSFTGKYKLLHSKLDPKLLVMGTVNVYVQGGSTVALSANWIERSTTVAQMAHKILDGAKAGEIPVSMITPEKADFFVNKDKMASVGLKGLDKLGMKITYINEKK